MKLLALIRKEFLRFFRDARLIFAVVMPGLLIYVLYSILGGVVNKAPGPQSYKVYCEGTSAATAQIEAVVAATGSTLEWLAVENPDEAKAAVEKGEATAYLSFSENFDTAENATVLLYFSQDSEASTSFYSIATAALQSYGMRFTILPQAFSKGGGSMQFLSALLPFLIVALILSAAMSVTIEAVAGEKERGTLATILATSVKRSHIALGKIIPLCCIAMIGALSSFLGVALSMPKLMGTSLVLGSYGFMSYFLLFLLIVSVVPLIVSIISAVSTWSRSVKEATAYTGFIMILVIVITLVTGFLSGIGDWVVAVPIVNAVTVMQRILTGGVPVWQALVRLGANLAYTALLVLLIAKMFSSEKVMFGK